VKSSDRWRYYIQRAYRAQISVVSKSGGRDFQIQRHVSTHVLSCRRLCFTRDSFSFLVTRPQCDQTADRRRVKSIPAFIEPRCRMTNSHRQIISTSSPLFFTEGEKWANFALIFDPTRIPSTVVSKWSHISKI